jgi:hypothetical protein
VLPRTKGGTRTGARPRPPGSRESRSRPAHGDCRQLHGTKSVASAVPYLAPARRGASDAPRSCWYDAGWTWSGVDHGAGVTGPTDSSSTVYTDETAEPRQIETGVLRGATLQWSASTTGPPTAEAASPHQAGRFELRVGRQRDRATKSSSDILRMGFACGNSCSRTSALTPADEFPASRDTALTARLASSLDLLVGRDDVVIPVGDGTGVVTVDHGHARCALSGNRRERDALIDRSVMNDDRRS